LINFQLQEYGYPHIIIRDKEKHLYYKTFSEFREKKSTKGMEQIIYLALSESLHKRITYLKGQEIITLADYAKLHNQSLAGLINMGRRHEGRRTKGRSGATGHGAARGAAGPGRAGQARDYIHRRGVERCN
jgi:hypothetical protein